VLQRDQAQFAQAISSLTTALNTAVMGDFLAIETATDVLLEYLQIARRYATDDPENPGERERIVEGMQVRRSLEDTGFNDALQRVLARLNSPEANDGEGTP